MEDYEYFEELDGDGEFETMKFSSEIDGKRVTAIIPKTKELDDIIIAFEDEQDPDNVQITKLKDKFVLAVAKLIVEAKYEDGEDDSED